MASDPIKPEDLFECHNCGDCCKGYGGTYVSREDIEAISRYIGSDPQRFTAEYCNFSGKRPVLAQKTDGYCIFWNQLCTIHPVKPQMCRKWPFLESILVEPNNWLIMADSCPGIRTEVPVCVAEKCIRDMLSKDSIS